MKSNGDIYFTDPPYGLPNRENDSRRELDHFGVYRIAKDGKLTLLTTELQRPNGLGFRRMKRRCMLRRAIPTKQLDGFPVKPDGTLEKGSSLRCDG